VAAGFAYHLATNGSGAMSLHADSFSVATSAPRLRASRLGNSIAISWPAPGTWVLQTATNAPATWTDVSTLPSVLNDRFVVTLPTSQPWAQFRLRP
jgi:hypothetical protein